MALGMTDGFAVREVAAAASPELAETLAACGLPVDDLAEPGRRFFRFAGPDDALIGFVGAEAAQDAVLLRSLAVVPERRGEGWGERLLGWALDRMAAEGHTEAYALTTTIAPLLVRWGWAPVARAEAPPGIRASRQFAGLCPASAALLRKPLTPPAGRGR